MQMRNKEALALFFSVFFFNYFSIYLMSEYIFIKKNQKNK